MNPAPVLSPFRTRLGRIRRIGAPVVVGASAAAILGAAIHAASTEIASASVPPPAPTPTQGPSAPPGFADLAERVAPSVVNIRVSGPEAAGLVPAPGPELPPGPWFGPRFREFFERYFEDPRPVPPGPRPVSQGSGFLIDPEGLVVTNHHVVRGTTGITVTLHDGRRFEAEVRGVDEKTDLALLSIPAEEPLPHVELGDSDALRVGDWVVAVGNPFGLGGTVTAGIVSARGRDIRSGPFDDYLQIDAPINRGSSGGPLFDTSGRVVGVNTAIFSPSGGNVGIGFAIPARLARDVIEDLKRYGEVERGWMGVRIQPVDEDIAESVGLESSAGALVVEVIGGGPAEAAGIRVGDVILEFDARAVPVSRRLPHLVAEAPEGEEVQVVVWRDGERESLRLVIGRLPAEGSLALSPARAEEAARRSLGLSLAPLSAELRARYDLDDDLQGALVTRVSAGSAAAGKGLRAGDVIVRAGERPVTGPGDVADALSVLGEQDRERVLLLVERRGARRFVALPVDPDAASGHRSG